MKKASLKKEIGGMLEAAQEVYEFRERGELMAERQIKNGNFKASFVSSKEDEESRRLAEEYIRKRAEQFNRQLRHFPASELNERSNNFQKAMAYIGEHRHLIPFFRFVDEYLHENPKKSETDAVREWKKKHKSLPAEVTFESWGYGSQGNYTLGDKLPDIATVAAQIPYLPKAWML